MATDVFGDYEDQERHYDYHESSRVFELSTIRELTEQAAEDIRESMKILLYEMGEEHDRAYGLAKMVVAHRMRVMGADYGYAV